MTEILGNIHSIETCGTVDGPGIRFVVFTQGCPMRCLYCHNPDTWGSNIIQKQISANDILAQYDSVKEFCRGGITVTGGEPLLQMAFIVDLFKKAHDKGIHTALDTSGIIYSAEKHVEFDELIKYTDLVLLDIKHIDDKEHIKLTKHSNKNILSFAKYLSENNIPVWIRHVIVPNINNKEEYYIRLGEFMAELNNVKALDVLPYHNMAIPKYENLGIEYTLKDTPPLTKEEAINARNTIIKTYKTLRNTK